MSQDKEKQTRKLRYSKSIISKFNYEEIINTLSDIQGECDNIRYMVEDDDILASALGDNDEEAYEFKMMFSDLSGKAEQLYEILNEYNSTEDISEYFDQITAGISEGSGLNYYAWDSVEEDFFRVTSYEGTICVQESIKKLLRMKKEDLISCCNRVFRIMLAYLDLKYKYDYLSATLEILNDEQHGIIDMVKELDRLYKLAEADKFEYYSESLKNYEKALKAVPDRMWIE